MCVFVFVCVYVLCISQTKLQLYKINIKTIINFIHPQEVSDINLINLPKE